MKKLLIVLALLLCVGTAEAAERVEAKFFSNFGGLNTKDSPILIDEKESPDCQNVYFTTKGAIVKRNGYDRLNETGIPGTPDQITSFYQYNLDNGSTFAVATAGTKIYKMDSLDGTWDDITDTNTITADKNWKWITWKNTLVGTNETNIPLKWTGTGNAALLTVPTNLTSARDIIVYRNYVILLNVTVDGTLHPSRLYYSNLNTLETWTDIDLIDIAPGDGDPIVGAIVLGGDLYVLKEKSIYQMRLTGDSVNPFVVKKTNSHIGALSTYSIINVNNTILFNSQDGFYGFNGNQSIKISDRIDPTYNALSKANLDKVVAANYKKLNHVWFGVPATTTNNNVLVWDYSNNAWTKYVGINAAAIGTYIDAGTEKLFHGDYAGIVFQDDSGDSDDGTAIDGYWTSKWMDFGSPGVNKRVEHAYMVTAASGNWNLDVGYSYDFQGNNLRTIPTNLNGGGALWGTAIWGTDVWSGESFLIKRLDIRGQGKFFNIQFSNDTVSQDFTVYGYGLILRPDGIN